MFFFDLVHLSYIDSFILGGREEIRRLKTQNPNIPHKEAFSTAAKNVCFRHPKESTRQTHPFQHMFCNIYIYVLIFQWAHFPPIHKHNKGEGESCEQDEGEASWNVEATEVSFSVILKIS